MAEIIRVLLVDDHPTIRLAVRMFLTRAADVEVVGEADDGQEALTQVEALRPDVVLLDCILPRVSGMEVAAAIQQRGLPARVLAFSAYEKDCCVQGMLEAGAVGYLLKSEPLEAILAAVRAAARGEGYFSPAVMDKVTAWARGERPAGLTKRELEVLRLLARGQGNQWIAEALSISERTVRFHLRNIYDKIKVDSRVGAAVWAVQHRLGRVE